MKSRVAVRGWYAALVAVILVAIIGQLVIVVDKHGSVANFFSYFTVESNLLVLVTAALLVADPSGGSAAARQVVRLAALTGITVTGVVYGGLIAPFVSPTGVELLYDTLFHYVAPAGAVVGFLLIGPHGLLRRAHLAFIGWPLVWLGYTMIRGEVSHPGFARGGGTTSRYPYGFLDVELHGWGYVAGFIVLIAVLLLAIAWVYVAVDRRLGASVTRPTVEPATAPERVG